MIKINTILKLLIDLDTAKESVVLSFNIYKKLYNRMFNGKDRIIIPYIKHYDVIFDIQIPAQIKKKILLLGYTSYNLNRKLAQSINHKNQQISIGRLLTKHSPLLLKSWELWCRDNSVLDDYANPLDNLLIIISRHPVDIAGMSIHQSWLSCLN